MIFERTQVKVDVVGAEVLKRVLERLLDALVVGVVELGREPDLRPRDARVDDALADLGLVAVGGGRVDVTVAGLQGGCGESAGSVGGVPARRRGKAEKGPRR